jgi:hypothetical protein
VPSGGGAPVNVTNTAFPLRESFGSVSPDGSKLIFSRVSNDPSNDFFHPQIVIANADGSSPSPISTPALKAASNPVWAPGGALQPQAPIAAFDATAPKKVKKGKSLSVTLRCTGDTQCVVTYSAIVLVPGKGKKTKTYKIKAKTITLGAKTSKTVKIAAPSSAKKPIEKALKKGKKPTIKVTATAKQPNGGPTIRTVKLSTRITS